MARKCNSADSGLGGKIEIIHSKYQSRILKLVQKDGEKLNIFIQSMKLQQMF